MFSPILGAFGGYIGYDVLLRNKIIVIDIIDIVCFSLGLTMLCYSVIIFSFLSPIYIVVIRMREDHYKFRFLMDLAHLSEM